MLHVKPSMRVIANFDEGTTQIMCPQWSHEQLLRLKDRLKGFNLHPHFMQMTYKAHVRACAGVRNGGPRANLCFL